MSECPRLYYMGNYLGIDPGKGGGIAVYTLADPTAPERIRYVGHAVDPIARLRRHVHEAEVSRKPTHKLNWLRSIAPRTPVVEILGWYSTRAEAAACEVESISSLRLAGHDLTNSTRGGDGVVGWTPELRARMSAIKSGLKLHPHSAETRRKISEAQRGKRHLSPEQYAAIGLKRRGIKQPPDTVERRVAKLRGRKRPQGVVDKYLAKLRTPEVRKRLSEAARKQWREGRGWAVSAAARRAASEVKKKHWADGVYAKRLGARNADGTWAEMAK